MSANHIAPHLNITPAPGVKDATAVLGDYTDIAQWALSTNPNSAHTIILHYQTENAPSASTQSAQSQDADSPGVYTALSDGLTQHTVQAYGNLSTPILENFISDTLLGTELSTRFPSLFRDTVLENNSLATILRGAYSMSKSIDEGFGRAIITVSGFTLKEDALARALLSTVTGKSVTDLVETPGSITENTVKTWQRKISLIQKAALPLISSGSKPQDWEKILSHDVSETIAFVFGALAEATLRKTPVILDGPLTHCVAVLVDTFLSGASTWFFAPQHNSDPAQELCIQLLNKKPPLTLNIQTNDGTVAQLALNIIQHAESLFTLQETPQD